MEGSIYTEISDLLQEYTNMSYKVNILIGGNTMKRGRPRGSTSRIYGGSPHTVYSRSARPKENEFWVTGSLFEEEILNPEIKDAFLSNFDRSVVVDLNISKLRKELKHHGYIQDEGITGIKKRSVHRSGKFICIQDIPFGILEPAVNQVQFYKRDKKGLMLDCETYSTRDGRINWAPEADLIGTAEEGLKRLFNM